VGGWGENSFPSPRRIEHENRATENAGVEIMAPKYRGGKRERSDYGKPKFT